MVNYDIEMQNLISTLDEKKKLLLHSCCGPCSTAVITRLQPYFDITIFYYNPCLYPDSEYEKRLQTQLDFLSAINKTSATPIKVVVPQYDGTSFLIATESMAHEPEGGKRCYYCYADRLKATFDYAKDNGFDYFCTTLSVSPYKHSDWLNEIGMRLQNEQCKYLISDFKKKDGYKNSIDLSKKYKLYRQNYCGCKYTYLDMLEREKVE